MRWLITGASGQLGAYVLRELQRQGEKDVIGWTGQTTGELFGFTLQPMPLHDAEALRLGWSRWHPDVVIHTGAMARVEACYRDPRTAFAVNVVGSGQLAQCAAGSQVRFIYLSTDLVFDGERGDYSEQDEPRPLSIYGSTKLAGERCVAQYPGSVIVRLSLLFGPGLGRQHTFFDRLVDALRRGLTMPLFVDEYRTPLFLAAAAEALLHVARSSVTGLWHLGGAERLSRWEMGVQLAERLGADPQLIEPTSSNGRFAEPRPRDVSLNSSRFQEAFPQVEIPDYGESLTRALALIDR